MGKRGVGFCRANKYRMDVEVHYGSANEEILVAVQFEDVEAVANIYNILAVEGLDDAFVGPYELSACMGITGDFEHPDFIAARNEILASCKRNGVTPGIHVVQPDAEQAIDRLSDGFHLYSYSLDITMLLKACLSCLDEVHAEIPNKITPDMATKYESVALLLVKANCERVRGKNFREFSGKPLLQSQHRHSASQSYMCCS